MRVILRNCDDEKVLFDIGPLKDILHARMMVRSSDEVLGVLYKDGTVKAYDSDRHGRCMDFEEEEYTVYSDVTGVNLFENEQWKKRDGSHDWPSENGYKW